MQLDDIGPTAIVLLTIASLALLLGLLIYGLLCFRFVQTVSVLVISIVAGFGAFYGVAQLILEQLKIA